MRFGYAIVYCVAALVHILKTAAATTFLEYSSVTLYDYIKQDANEWTLYETLTTYLVLNHIPERLDVVERDYKYDQMEHYQGTSLKIRK